ncbi:MAG TPA: PAS domain S-box protein [Burkholderiaceae bacterium]|nr:PAS domain S-box protein [Burkholderiaceae bacterium]
MPAVSALTPTVDHGADRVRLLVIDDDDVDRERVVRLAANSPLSAETTQAASSNEAIALLKSRPFDCVVLDNQLPDGSGAELLRALRADFGPRCPVIMVTGAGDEELAAEVMRSGASDYLPKNRLSPDNLCRAITRSIEAYRLREQLDRFAKDLAASEAKYRAMVEDQTELVSLSQPDLTLAYVNSTYAAHCGLPPEKMIGRNLLDFVADEQRDLVAAQMRKVRHHKTVEHGESRLKSAAGTDPWVAWTHRPLLDALGSTLSIHSVGRDITDEVRGREAVSRLAAIVDSTADAILSTNLNDEITSWNPAAERLFGRAAQEAIGRPVGLIVPADRQSEERMLMQRVRGGESIVEFQTIRLRRNEKLIEVALTLSPIRDAGGKIVGVSQIARDVSERKRLERTLVAGERQNRELYEATPAMLHSMDVEGRILSVSDAWLAHLGFVRSEVLDRPFSEFLAPVSRHMLQQEILPHLLRTGRCSEVALRMVRCDGNLIDVLFAARLERDPSGYPWRALAVVQEVSDSLRR